MGLGDILSDISAFSNPFGASNNSTWNIGRGIFKNSRGQEMVFFFENAKEEDRKQRTAIDQTQDAGGRRLAVYEYPYRDGQAVDDLGRKGETYSFNVKFFGTNYQRKFQDFLRMVVTVRGTGYLTHPTYSAIRGTIPVKFRDYEIIHRHDEWNAVTIRATFIEDNTGIFQLANLPKASSDSILRSALQILTNAQSIIGNLIFELGALAKLPGAMIASMQNRLSSITGGVSRLLGQLAATFSSNAHLQRLASQSSNMVTLSSGSVKPYNGETGTLPPVYQTGYDKTTQDSINKQSANFVNANQITPQQAVFSANQSRTAISEAIAEVTKILGNDGSDIVLHYRNLSVAIQEMVESCIASAQNQVKIYTVPQAMSLRMVAKENDLTPDRQNDIENLNPYLPSVNYIPAGTKILVPAS